MRAGDEGHDGNSGYDETLDGVPRIDLRIPGPWISPDELADALEEAGTGYEPGGDGTLVHAASGASFALSASEPDDQIADVFAGGGRISPAEVRRVRSHKVKVHLSTPGGSVDAARAAMNAVAALLRAGGHGVMVDNSGVTHAPRDWLDLARDPDDPGGLYWAYVAVTADDDEAYSTGMHCLGFRDAEVPLDATAGDRQAAGLLLHNFLGYTLQSGMRVLDGDPIGDEHATLFRARVRPCTRFPAGTPFFNAYGVWRLEPAEGEEDVE
jgi:hypothetical protein